MKLNSACLAVLLPIAAAADYRCVDLRTKVTTGFSDSVANDYMGGWFDEGRNDLRTFPVGKRTFAGVVFDVIDPDGNGGASCIALRSSNRPYFPLEVKGIALPSGKWDRIHVLQSAAWGDDKLHGEPVIDYVLTYRDGTRAFLPMRFMRDVGNWWVPKDLPTASLAWAGYNPLFYRLVWNGTEYDRVYYRVEGKAFVPSAYNDDADGRFVGLCRYVFHTESKTADFGIA